MIKKSWLVVFRRLAVALLFVALATSSLLILSPARVSAATGDVVDRSTIKIGNRVFVDGDIDDNFNYKETNSTDNCPDEIRGFNNSDLRGTNTPSSATLRVGTSNAGSSQCNYRDENITFNNRENFTKAFVWVDQDTIKGSDGKVTFKRDGSSRTFVSEKSSSGQGGVRCSDTITVNANNQGLSLQERKGSQQAGHDYDWYPFNPGGRSFNQTTQCWEAPVINNIRISGTPTDGNEGAGAGGSDTGTDEGSDDDSCESQGGVMGWILCPVILLLDNGLELVDTQIANLLNVDSNQFRNTGARDAWGVIRNIAFFITIPIMLVMVMGTALGFEFVSAYSVKRALPRLFAAIIFMSLSFAICTFLVDVSNNVGKGTLGLLTYPFGESVGTLSLGDLFSTPTGGGKVLSGVLLPFKASAAFVGILVLLWLFGSTILLFAAIGFIVLMIRQMFIVLLILIAPIAILSWVFPGNDKLWKTWWSLFSKLLIMYPLIMALIAAGRIFAFIINEGNSESFAGDIVAPIGKLIAYMVPYALIPLTFKFAGGVFATLTGGVDGLINSDARQKKRAEKRADKLQRAGSGNVLSGRNKFERMVNKAAPWATSPHQSAMYELRKRNVPFLSARGRRLESSIHAKSAEQSKKLVNHWNDHGANDKFYRAVGGMYSGFGNDIQAQLIAAGFATGNVLRDDKGNVTDVQGIKAVKSLRTEKDFMDMAKILSTGGDSDRKAATALEANAAYTAAMYADPEMNYANTAMAGSMGLASHGFFGTQDSADLYNLVKSETDSAGFAHLATVTAQNIGKGSHPENKPGYGHEVLASGEAVPGIDSRSERGWAVTSTLSSQDFSGMKGDVLGDSKGNLEGTFGQTLVDVLKVGSGNQEARSAIAAELKQAGFSDQQIKTRFETAEKNFASLSSTIANVISPYSTASAGVKAQVAKIIEASGVNITPPGDDGGAASQNQGRPGPGGGGAIGGGQIGGGGGVGGSNIGS